MDAHLVMRALLEGLPSRLAKLPVERLAHKSAPDRWSSKEEFGHLLDSAVNNHQRIVRGHLADGLALPGYDGERWVEVHRYQQREWQELIDLWHACNTQLLAAAEAVPDSAWSHTCRINDSAPVSLKFVYEDYIHHMLHHLRHIGVETDDLLSSMPSLRGAWQPWIDGRPPQR
jgi:hypothetical protein